MSRNETKKMRKAKKVCLADLAKVGPGTPAGQWFRRYWMVAGTTRDLYDIPQAVRLLGEDLVLFRDANGKIGLVGQNCPHRGTSLEYGEIEDGGIRCPYHGWLFNIHGQCLEMPGEPKDSKFAAKVKHLAYPVKELGGLIFAYMGPDQDNPPPLPKYRALADPTGQRSLEATRLYDYNWFNFIENGADPVHFSTLHRADADDGTWRSWFFNFRDVPPFDAVETAYGMKVISRKPGPAPDTEYADVKSFALPSILQIGDTEFTHFKQPKEALAAGSLNAHFMFLAPNDDDAFYTLYRQSLHRGGPGIFPKARAEPSHGSKDGKKAV